MENRFQETADSFEQNAQEVERLLTFDRLIIDVAVDGLKHIEAALEAKHINSVINVVRNRAQLLSNIAESKSLQPHYSAMFNQCVVLLVSYFGAATHTLFRQGVSMALASGAPVSVSAEELKVSWRAVSQAEGDREAMFADLLIAQHDISFQDMQSICRAFEKHLGVSIERTEVMNNIIMGQAGRHVIVHTGGVIDAKLVRQVTGARPRGLLPELALGTLLQFQPFDVRLLAASMRSCIASIVASLAEAEAEWQRERAV